MTTAGSGDTSTGGVRIYVFILHTHVDFVRSAGAKQLLLVGKGIPRKYYEQRKKLTSTFWLTL